VINPAEFIGPGTISGWSPTHKFLASVSRVPREVCRVRGNSSRTLAFLALAPVQRKDVYRAAPLFFAAYLPQAGCSGGTDLDRAGLQRFNKEFGVINYYPGALAPPVPWLNSWMQVLITVALAYVWAASALGSPSSCSSEDWVTCRRSAL